MSSNAGKDLKPVEGMSFEECFQELEQLVEKFEHGQMALSESVDRFERGIQLLKKCSNQLTDAEKKVTDLMKRIAPADADMGSEDTMVSSTE